MSRIVVCFTLLLGCPAIAEAQPAMGQPAWGLYAELDAGATQFVGETQRFAALGPTFGIRVGKDITSWFAAGGVLATSMHEATVPPPPEDEYFQLYTLGAEARFTARLGRLALFAEAGAGLAYISTNVLERVAVTDPDERWTVVWRSGGGAAWHTRNRHFSLGLAADFALYPSYDSTTAIGARLYLRYTK